MYFRHGLHGLHGYICMDTHTKKTVLIRVIRAKKELSLLLLQFKSYQHTVKLFQQLVDC